LSPEFTQTLIKTALELHDGQMDAAARWKHFIPLWTALITGLLVMCLSGDFLFAENPLGSTTVSISHKAVSKSPDEAQEIPISSHCRLSQSSIHPLHPKVAKIDYTRRK
jgi:hypothetical protein